MGISVYGKMTTEAHHSDTKEGCAIRGKDVKAKIQNKEKK